MNSLFGNYITPLFVEVWGDAEAFLSDYKECGLYLSEMTDANMKTLFYLLYARHGNDAIASSDTNRFKYSLFSQVFQYGPTWQRKLEIQKTMREWNEEDLRASSESIHNHAVNPSTEPSNKDYAPLPYINEQNASGRKRSKIEGYAMLIDLLDDDITGEFIRHFDRLFTPIAAPQTPLYYTTEPTMEV